MPAPPSRIGRISNAQQSRTAPARIVRQLPPPRIPECATIASYSGVKLAPPLLLLPLLALPVYAGGQSNFADLAAQAAAARQANDIPRAIDLYRQALALDPKWAEGWWSIGTVASESNRFADCRDAMSQFVRIQAKVAPAWALLGLCEFQTSDFAASLQHIRQALTLGTGLDKDTLQILLFHEALLLTQASQFTEAMRIYAQMASAGGGDDTVVAGVGLAALRKPLLPDQIPPSDMNLCMTAGIASLQAMTGNDAAAQKTFDDLLRRYPSTPNVHFCYATWLLRTRIDDGLAQLKRELQIDHNRNDVRAMIAVILVQQGDMAGALPWARDAAERAPSLALAQYIYGRILAQTGSLDDGIARLEQSLHTDPDSIDCHIALATAYSRKGRAQDALRERLRTIEIARARATPAQ